MRALFIHAARDLRIEPVAVPELGPGDVRVRMEAGGICGSDLHYYQHGGFGTIRLRQPMVLGHEIAGTVEAVGADVASVGPGDRVAVNPSRPCNRCRYCLEGRQQHCLDMRFYGSAMRFPHVDGGFREAMVIEERQAVKVPAHVSAQEAAFAEPFAVCLHAVRRAGSLLGRKVLVTGSGPIGALAVVAAKAAGAAEIVATDVTEAPLPLMRRMGATRTINTAADPDALNDYGADKGYFDVLFEASGSEQALVGAFAALQPGAIIVQIGIGNAFTLPINVLVAKEFDLRGTFRFHEEFALAAAMIGSGAVDLAPLLTASLPLDRAVEAFELAGDRSRSMKVQIAF